MEKIAFGGSCHWCTEGIFQSLKGVLEVKQGWIASDGETRNFSVAIIVLFDPSVIPQHILIQVHLHTHSATSLHAMRNKYRSAVYIFNEPQAIAARLSILHLQTEFQQPIITEVLPFRMFTLNQEKYPNYYYNDTSKPFCKNYITPKVLLLLKQFPTYINEERITRII